MTFAAVCGVASYLLYILAFSMHGLTWLRVITLAALAAECVYLAHPTAEEPMWLGIGCNVVVGVVNLGWLVHDAWERWSLRAAGRELELYEAVLRPHLRAPAALRLLRVGAWRTVGAGDTLISAGDVLSELSLLARGQVRVMVNGAEVARLGPGALLGEMSWVTGRAASASVIAEGEVQLLSFTRHALRPLLDRSPELATGLGALVGHDMAAKLTRRAS